MHQARGTRASWSGLRFAPGYPRLTRSPMSLAALSPPDRLPLLTAVPWLGELLSPERRRTLEAALRVDVRHISRGPLELGRLQSASPTNVGLLLIEGVVSREVVL